MRDPRDGTWLAVVKLGGAASGARLRVARLVATGRHGLQALLRDPDPLLSRAEAIGLDFPFAVPEPFATTLFEDGYPDDGWWGLVRRFAGMSRPEFLTRVQEFRESHGAPKRLTDEVAGTRSPLDRAGRDVGPMAYHGIRMIGEDRSRFAVRPFETAQARLLLEVRPDRRVKSPDRAAELGHLPVDAGDHARTMRTRGALSAVLAARAAAIAMLRGEPDKGPDELAPGEGARVLREGWIYGRE